MGRLPEGPPRPLGGRELLRLWEWGQERPAAHRVIGLLLLAWPDCDESTLLDLPVGLRDGLLLDLHAAMVGAELHAVVRCPVCGDESQLDVACADVRLPAPERWEWAFEAHGIALTYRLPTTRDLVAVGALGDPVAARGALLRRCVLAADEDPSDAVLAALGEALLERDPQADLRFSLTCLACGHGWVAPLYVGDFLWAEVDVRARRLMREVHHLAREYGWSEADALAIGPHRREFYLRLGDA